MTAIDRWRADPIVFVEDALRDPETGKPFVLYAEEVEFLRMALTTTADGRLPYVELLFSAPKKSGKTLLAAIAMLYVIVVLAGRFGEGYAVANDFDQAAGRVFAACAKLVECSPILAGEAKITGSKITFHTLGSFIEAIPSDYAGAAGSNPNIVIFDELWAYTTERAHRLWDEMVPPPTRKITARLTVTYAGFDGESDLLQKLVTRGLQGEIVGTDLRAQPGMLAYVTHECRAPWQTGEWQEEMRRTLRPNAYLRLIENRFVGSESTFIDIAWWDACCASGVRPILADRGLDVWVGVDASVKRDSTAIAVCAWDDAARKIRLVWHRIWQPSANEPLNFELTIEATLLELKSRFRLREVRFDPYQMQSSAQRLRSSGVPMVEFPQSVPNLTEASTNLYEAIKSQNLVAYRDDAIRLAVQRAVAAETSRGWRIAKEKQAHKIDVVVALGMAALGAVNSTPGPSVSVGFYGEGGAVQWTKEDRPRPTLDRKPDGTLILRPPSGGWYSDSKAKKPHGFVGIY